MIFLTAAATKGAQRNKGPDHGIQVVDPLLSPSPPYWLWPVLKSAANYLLTHFEKRHLLVLVANIFFAIAIVKHANDLHRILCWKLSRNKSKVDSVPIGRDKSTPNIFVTAAPGGSIPSRTTIRSQSEVNTITSFASAGMFAITRLFMLGLLRRWQPEMGQRSRLHTGILRQA
jgi:hypothetical protein